MTAYQWAVSHLPSWGLVMTMLGLGLALKPVDFARILQSPHAVAVGLAAQIIGLPLVAAALILVFRPDPLLAMVLVGLAASPGGASSNALTLLAKGNLPLGVTLTAANSLVAFLTTPLIVTWGARLFGGGAVAVKLASSDIVSLVVLQVVAPIVAGLFLARWLRRYAEPIVYTGLGFIIVPTVLVGVSTIGGGPNALFWPSVVLCGLFNLLCTGVGYLAAVAARLDGPAQRTMMIETGIHNFGLFVVIASQVFGSLAMVRAGAPYLFWMLGTATGVVILNKMRSRKGGCAQAA